MENIKSDILNTATSLFKKCGIRSVSIDDVCKELHISKKTFYIYFKQKEELIEQVLQDFHKEQKNKAYQWRDDVGKNCIDMLMEFDKKMKFNTDESDKNISMLFDLEKYYPKIFQRHVERMREIQYEGMKNFINKGVNEGVFRQDLDMDLAALFFASQFGNLKTFVQVKTRRDIFRVFCFFRDVLIRILANEKGMDYYLENYYNKT